jgi:hypothetical protein
VQAALKVIVSRLRGVAAVGLTLAIVAGASVLATPAGAASVFTLDPAADSMGPIAVDSSGNGYVAWLHKGTPDTVMFCRFAPSARSCPGPITLPVTLAEPSSVTSTPFPVLGPGSDVYVVAPSYDSDQMVIWQSTDGGLTFGAPWVAGAPIASEKDYVCQVGTDLDDVLAFNAYGGQYDPSQGLSTLGGSASNLEFQMSSSNPFIDWTFAFYDQGCVVPASAEPVPGKIPDQAFSFASGAGEESSLGWVSGPAGECPLSYPGDEVEAYEEDHTNPSTVRFYHYSSPTGKCEASEHNDSAGAIGNWGGPTVITQGAFPRLAGGDAGLFLLSGDAVSPPASEPTAVDVRHYDLATHNFGAPTQLAVVKNLDFGTGGPAGGLGESYTTGELAAVWPDVAGATNQLSLWISTDGGAHFSSAQDIAHISGGYASFDNARVALAPDGEGFVTWEDGAGLHVANLEQLSSTYARLVVHHSLIKLEVTCESPKATCIAGAVIRVKGTVVAVGHGTVPSGTTTLLPVRLNATGRALFKAAHGHLHAKLHLIVTDPGANTERLTVNTLLVR